MKQVLDSTEKVFAVFGLLFFTGVFMAGGQPGSDQPILLPDWVDQISRYLIWGTSTLLLCLRWKTAFRLALTDWALWGVTLLAVMSFAWSDFPELTMTLNREILQMTAFGWYMATRFTLKEQIRMLGWALLIGGLVSLFLVFAAPSIGKHVGEHNGAWRGIYGHKNLLGSRMVLSSVVCFLIATDQRPNHWAWIGYLGSVVMVILCTSKGALVYCFLLPVLIQAYRVFRWRGKSTVIVLDLLILSVGSALTALAFNWITLVQGLGKDPTLSGRIPIWEVALTRLQDRPFLGFGRSAFWAPGSPFAIQAGQAVSPGFVPPHGHNGFIDMLLDIGWVGFILFVISLVFTIMSALRLAYNKKESATLWPLAFLFFLVANNLSESLLLLSTNMYWTMYVTLALSVKDRRIAEFHSEI